MTTPTKRSLKKLRDEGYAVAIVEHWNSFARIRQDLFGIFDLLALKDGETLAVQVTSSGNLAARVHKISEAPIISEVRAANWTVHAHGWRKNSKGKWVCRVIDLS